MLGRSVVSDSVQTLDCSPSGSSVHGILQTRILEWVPCPPPGDLPDTGIDPRCPALQVDSLPSEPPEKPMNTGVGSLPGIFPTQESNWGLLHCWWIFYQLSYQETPSSCIKTMKEESEKADLKLNIQKVKIMAFGPITSGQIDGESMETVTDFISLGSKVTADVDFSCKIKRCLLLGRKAMPKLDSVLKSRDIPLPTKVHIVRAMVFLVVMYGCEIWNIKTIEH